jgi:asparagine synthase (glutamine-hydrolysing)
MLDVLRHRGPDDAGLWSGGPVTLGSRRLAILDLSAAGHQPMSDREGSIVVIENGEIYNFEELRQELAQAGREFRSHSDAEVLVQGFAEWGLGLLPRLRGMFAFALWNERDRQLLLARDRFGIKPLYYRLERDAGGLRLLFASEIKAILAVQRDGPRANPDVIHDFLADGLLEHTADTFFDGIVKLPPAHWLTVDAAGHVRLGRYWDFTVNPDAGVISEAEDRRAAAAFRDAFFESVRYHLVSDVPIGSCLSGGLDSSAVVCATSRLLAEGSARTPTSRQWTFTSSFEDLRYDERRYALEVARAADTDARFTFPSAAGFVAELPALLHHQEEPFASTSVYAQWCLMRDIHKSGLKVVLDGQGGDELLLGYGKFYLFHLQDLARQGRLGLLGREALALIASPRFWMSLDLRHGLRYMGRAAALGGERRFLSRTLAARSADRRFVVGLDGGLAERIKRDITMFSLPVLLRYEDKNAMAFSVESRVPFVDHVLLEEVARLPLNQKLRRGWTKFVMREALRGVLPESVRLRRDKIGFVTPEEVWFRGELAREIEDTFAGATYLWEWADLPRLRDAFAAHRRRPGVLSHSVFFRYFIVERWARQFLGQA